MSEVAESSSVEMHTTEKKQEEQEEIKDWTPQRKCKYAVITLTIMAVVFGIMFACFFAAGAFKSEWEQRVIWEVTVPLLVLSMVLIVFLLLLSRRITRSFLEDQSTGDEIFKNAVSQICTNLSVVCALITSIAVALCTMEYQGVELTNTTVNSSVGDQMLIFYWFYGLSTVATTVSFGGTIMGVLSLLFTDSLSNDAVKLFVQNFPGAIGIPYCLFIGSCIYLAGALIAWTVYFYKWVFMIGHIAQWTGLLGATCFFYWKCQIFENTVDAARKSHGRVAINLEDNTVDDISKMLAEAGLDQFVERFKEHEIDGKILKMMKERHLAKILSPEDKIGDRIRLYKELGFLED